MKITKIKPKKKGKKLKHNNGIKSFYADRSTHLREDLTIIEIHNLLIKPCLEQFPDNWKGNAIQWIEHMWGTQGCPIKTYLTLEEIKLNTVNRIIYFDLENGKKDIELSDGTELKIRKYTKIIIRKETNGMAEIEIDNDEEDLSKPGVSYTYTLDKDNYQHLINKVKQIC